MLASTQERIESLLTTIDTLGMAKIKHLLHIHDLKSYRNAARIVATQLKPYLNETFHEREKVFYLNKDGRSFIGSEKESKKPTFIAHTLLRNEVYIHFQCPADWKNEYTLETQLAKPNALDIHLNGLKFNNKRKVICDAMFSRNGYVHFIEVDHKRDMIDNKKKIESYAEILPLVRKNFEQTPILYFFTTTETRKKKFQELLKGRSIRHEVWTFDEIK